VVPISIFTLKLSQKAALIIFVPLLLQFAFLVVLLINLNQAETQIQAEATSLRTLSCVNIIFNDALKAAANVALARFSGYENVHLDFQHNLQKYDEHRQQLEDLARTHPEHAADIKVFLSLSDDTRSLIEHAKTMLNEGDPFGGVREIARIKEYVQHASSVGDLIVEERLNQDDQLRLQQAKARDRLRQSIEVLSLLNILTAIVAAIVLNAGFAKRLDVLARDTSNIAAGKPLSEPLKGSDELAKLDQVIHNLSGELSVSRQRERAMIDNAADMIMSLDEKLRILEANPAVSRIGYEPDDLIGKTFQSLVLDEDRKIVQSNLEKMRETSTEAFFELRMRKKDGKQLHLTGTARRSSGEKSTFLTLHDETARVESERLKADVLAMVSHDLRSSLNSLEIILELLLEGSLGSLNEKGERMITKADTSVSFLLNMINDLLEIERIEAGGIELHYQTISTKQIVQEAIELIYAQAENKNIRVDVFGKGYDIDADPERLRRVLLNLLTNAIKFSPESGRITVGVEQITGDYGEHQLEFRVNDEGEGIPLDKAHLVFEKFKQLENSNEQKRTGSGLGLAICKALVEAHRGTIGVENISAGGSSFWFKLPLSRPS
jgi:PAS domain S-box-containing protein